MGNEKQMSELDRLRDDWYGHEAMRWYGWGSPIGLGLLLLSVGGMVFLLHLANLIG